MPLPHCWERVLHNLGEYIEGLWKYELCRCTVSKVTATLPKLKFQPSYLQHHCKDMVKNHSTESRDLFFWNVRSEPVVGHDGWEGILVVTFIWLSPKINCLNRVATNKTLSQASIISIILCSYYVLWSVKRCCGIDIECEWVRESEWMNEWMNEWMKMNWGINKWMST